VRSDSFKHLFDVASACRTFKLDIGTPVLIHHRTSVLSNKCSILEVGVGVPDVSQPQPGGRLRLTRRGRVVVIGFFLALAVGVAVLLAPSSRASDPPGPAPTVVVRSGDTLWSVAERHQPDQQPLAVIAEIRRLNGLDNYRIYVGQQLALPRSD
jgi:hypothetical protein